MAKDKPSIGIKNSGSFSDWNDLSASPYDNFPSQQKLISEFYAMSRYDNVIKLTLNTIKNLIKSKKGNYFHENVKIEEKVNSILSKMNGGTSKIFSNLLTALWAGYSVSEKVWNTDKNVWYIDKLINVNPLSFFDKYGESSIKLKKDGSLEITQYSDGEPIKLDRKSLVYFNLNGELEEEVLGSSLLSSARHAWYSKVYLQRYANTFGEKLAFPTPIIFTPIEEKENPFTGDVESIASIFTSFYDILRPGQALGIPVEDPSDIKLEYLQSSNSGEYFQWILKYCDAQMFLSMLTPNLLVEDPSHSSRAQAEVNLDVFHEILDGIRAELKNVIEQQVIKEIVDYNIGEVDDYGEWIFEPFRKDDMQKIADTYETITRGIRNVEGNSKIDLTEIERRLSELEK